MKKLVMVSVKPEDVLADHVELCVKGVFMPRGDLYRMMSSIVGKTVYGSKMFAVPVRRCGDDNCSGKNVSNFYVCASCKI